MSKPMTMTDVYEKLVELQGVLWKHYDLMTQDTLFEAQELVAALTLETCFAAGKKGEELVEKFPWLYTKG